MKDVSWKMSDATIVRRVSDSPAAQQTLPDPDLEEFNQGERMQFDAHVKVETMPQRTHLKKAKFFSSVPHGGTWQLVSDEGKAVGGRDTAHRH